jgi:diguanylate cyclase (GGDEF)-like protein
VEEQSEGFFRRADGAEFYTMFSISRFEPNHQEPAVLLLVKDINDRRTMERRLVEKNRDLELMAITDPLTGIYNRRYFDHKLAEEFRRMERYHAPLSLIMIDFDHFKIINDTFGHLAGDKVLSYSAAELTRGLRDVDILARWGGEEFMALLPETEEETALMVARRLHSLIRTSDKWAAIADGLKVTTSLGVVSLPWKNTPMSLTRVIEILDKTLYQAKENGRNRISRYLDSTKCCETL